jgi:GrpB-like predicted nucleotidyltransferase (UPF0157 family)
MAVTAVKAKIVAPFPSDEIEARIREFLDDEAAVQAVLHGGSTAPSPIPSIGPQPVIDSLVVVDVLVELESLVPFELPDSLVCGGGYDSVDAVVHHLLPQLQKRWKKHHEEDD